PRPHGANITPTRRYPPKRTQEDSGFVKTIEPHSDSCAVNPTHQRPFLSLSVRSPLTKNTPQPRHPQHCLGRKPRRANADDAKRDVVRSPFVINPRPSHRDHHDALEKQPHGATRSERQALSLFPSVFL